MVSETKQLHILFFPLMSPGHFIPMIDMACVFASYNVRATVVCTPTDASKIPAAKSKSISVVTIPFPSPDVTNLPPNKENLATIPPAMFGSFTAALYLLKDPLSQVITDLKPDCLVSDSVLSWTVDVASQFNIPRIVFHGPHVFPMYIHFKIFSLFPLEELEEEFWVDGMGEKIKLYKKGLPDIFQSIPFLMILVEAEAKSYGVVVNTYRDMEPAYVDWYKGFKKAWCVGPVTMGSIFNEEKEGGWKTETEVVKGEIVNWLDRKDEGSVLYVCFGSMNRFTGGQLRELALGLEKSGKNFLWVVRKEPKGDDVEEEEDWMPEDYQSRVGDRGLVVKGWAPQNAVLGHKATGWFLTHCGSTSVQESTCAGVPMITWPLFHEQFANVEFIVNTMGIGERMWEGFRKTEFKGDDDVIVTADEIAEVVGRVMGGGERYEAMKQKAKDYREKAKAAVEEGGSSYNDLMSLIQELKTL